MAKQKQRVEAVERQLLRDIQELTSRQFVYEDGWGGMVPFDGELTELQTGPPVPFAELTWREQADVLRSFIPWGSYPERAWDDEYRIRENIAASKQPKHWLEGTSLHQSFRLLAEGKTPPLPQQYPEITQQDLAQLSDALAKAEAEQSSARTGDDKLSLQDLRRGSQEQEKRGNAREVSRDKEMER